MNNQTPDPRDTPLKGDQPSFYPADQTPRREGGDDAIGETLSTDSNADEAVIVNEQREHKTVNGTSQTAVNSSEGTGSNEDIVD